MRNLLNQLRLLAAETLIKWAVIIAPSDHPDSEVIAKAGLMVFSRTPAE